MPKAFSLSYGLDARTEAASFWAWLNDVRDVMEGTGQPGEEVRNFVASQRRQIERYALTQPDYEDTRFNLSVAIALIGHHYASTQKLLNGLTDHGLLGGPNHPEVPAFHTINEPALETDFRVDQVALDRVMVAEALAEGLGNGACLPALPSGSSPSN